MALAIGGCAGRRHAGERPLAELAAGKMVEVPGGTFLLGERTGPARDVVEYDRVGAFLLDATEVTVAAYGECARAGRCKPATASVELGGFGSGAEWVPYCNADRADRADHPVNCVDWRQAEAYCAWSGKRLPTEGEWEWAARNGGAGTPFPWGDLAPADRACWNGDGNDAGRGKRAGTCAVRSHPGDATRAGVADLAGNVREWTSTPGVIGADSRGRGGSPGYVVRGGAWTGDDARDLLGSARGIELGERRDPRIGFRCASDR